jgi:hypothetical protein
MGCFLFTQLKIIREHVCLFRIRNDDLWQCELFCGCPGIAQSVLEVVLSGDGKTAAAVTHERKIIVLDAAVKELWSNVFTRAY